MSTAHADSIRETFTQAVGQLVPAYAAATPSSTLADSAVQRLTVLIAELDARGDEAASVYLQHLGNALMQLGSLDALPQTYREARLLTDAVVEWLPQQHSRSRLTLIDDAIGLILLDERGTKLLDTVLPESIARTWTILNSWAPGTKALTNYKAKPLPERSRMLRQAVQTVADHDKRPLFPAGLRAEDLEARPPVTPDDQRWILHILQSKVNVLVSSKNKLKVVWKSVGDLGTGKAAAMTLDLIAVLQQDRPPKGFAEAMKAHQSTLFSALAHTVPLRILVAEAAVPPASPDKTPKKATPNLDASSCLDTLAVDFERTNCQDPRTELASLRLTVSRPDSLNGGPKPIQVNVAVAYSNTAGAAEAFLGLGTAGTGSLARALKELNTSHILTPGGVFRRGPGKVPILVPTPTLVSVVALIKPGRSQYKVRPGNPSRWFNLGASGTQVADSDYRVGGWVREIGIHDPNVQPPAESAGIPPEEPQPTPTKSSTGRPSDRYTPSKGQAPPEPGPITAFRSTSTSTPPVSPTPAPAAAPPSATPKSTSPQTPKKATTATKVKASKTTSPRKARNGSERLSRRNAAKEGADTPSPLKKPRLDAAPPSTTPSRKAPGATLKSTVTSIGQSQAAGDRHPQLGGLVPRGMINAGTHCCLIAPLQALAHLPTLNLGDPQHPLYQYMAMMRPSTTSEPSESVAREIAKIFDSTKENGDDIDPNELYQAVKRLASESDAGAQERASWDRAEQQDAVDIVRFLVAAIDQTVGQCSLCESAAVTVIARYTSLPDTLIIGLKPRQGAVLERDNFANDRFQLLDVEVPDELDFSRWTDPAHYTDSTATRYALAAVVLYRKGEEARSGHYVCYCTPASTLRQGVLFDDRHVDVCQDWRPIAQGFVPYILFYIRKSTPQSTMPPADRLSRKHNPPTGDPSTNASPFVADPLNRPQRPHHAKKAPRLGEHEPTPVDIAEVADKATRNPRELPLLEKLQISGASRSSAMVTTGAVAMDESGEGLEEDGQSSRMSVDSERLPVPTPTNASRPSSRLSALTTPFYPAPSVVGGR